MKKLVLKIGIALFLVIGFSGTLNAQSMRSAENGQEIARKIGENMYEPFPAGIISYKFENNKFWDLWKGEPHESGKPRGYLSRKEDKIYYFNREDIMIGYYEPASQIYTHVSVLEDGSIGKEAEFAVLFEGTLSIVGPGEIKYNVDESFPPEIVGFIIFLN